MWKRKWKGRDNWHPARIYTHENIPSAIVRNGYGIRFEDQWFEDLKSAKKYAEEKYLKVLNL